MSSQSKTRNSNDNTIPEQRQVKRLSSTQEFKVPLAGRIRRARSALHAAQILMQRRQKAVEELEAEQRARVKQIRDFVVEATNQAEAS